MTKASPSVAPDRAELDALEAHAERLEREGPVATLEWAFAEHRGSIALATGFGVEGAALIDMAVRVEPNPFVFFVDTGFLFPETHELRRRLEERYRIEIRAVEPELSPQRQEDVYGARLWAFDPDFCCQMRKLEPLEPVLTGLGAWITAVRRDQTSARATARVVEWDTRWGLVKINPLAGWTREMVWDYVLTNRVPYNPLHDRGYPSIGCTHCTRAVRPGESERAGRWSGFEKTECGLHLRTERS
jgi:phosphoadenosine phosphosulfate reductase